MFSSLFHLSLPRSSTPPWRTTLILVSSLLGCTVFAQTPSDSSSTSQPSASSKLQRIVVEDAGSRVEEARVGGVTRQIEVQPKTGAPAYQIQPTTVQGPATPASERTGQPGGAGRSTWRVLSF